MSSGIIGFSRGAVVKESGCRHRPCAGDPDPEGADPVIGMAGTSPAMTRKREAPALLIAAILLAATPALAIVGGTENAGPLARETVMVLSSKGGVCSAVIVA